MKVYELRAEIVQNPNMLVYVQIPMAGGAVVKVDTADLLETLDHLSTTANADYTIFPMGLCIHSIGA